MRGIAHISFVGGGVFVPARNPYDRQLLVEHVAERTRAKGKVQVTVDDRCWSVSLNRPAMTVWCSGCGRSLEAACLSSVHDGPTFCLSCAFGDRAVADHAHAHVIHHRAAS